MERHVLMNSETSLMFSAVGLTLLSEVQISSVHSFHGLGTHKNINISIDTTEQRVQSRVFWPMVSLLCLGTK